MKWRDLLLQSLTNLWRRKLRTVLTMLGVLIGTISIIMMISIGLGLEKSTREMYESWGDLTRIEVNNYGGYIDENGKEIKSGKLNDKVIEQIRQLPHVTAATPMMQAYFLQISAGRYRYSGSFTGIKASEMETFGLVPDTGRLPDPKARNLEIVAGIMTKEYFYDPKATRWKPISVDWMSGRYKLIVEDWDNTTGQSKTREYPVLPVGINGVEPDPNDPNANMNRNYEREGMVYCDIDALKKILKNHRNLMRNYNLKLDEYEQAWVKVDKTENVPEVTKYLKETMGLQAWAMAEGLEIEQQSTRSIQTALGAIGAVSMLVAALMIANTMLMSIYERTREIGVMKVLGCRLMNIRMLFLGEAGLIGLIGGIIGVGLSFGGSAIINKMIEESNASGSYNPLGMFSSYIPPWLPLVGIAFAIGVAVVAGFYPAHRATRISALQAIRNDT